ncbi:MAG: hypothetical protein HYZ26_06640 [Chloroflexi bacterium]|nr:hypothetical protein [Chloroflexota bacterium]
MHSDRLDAGGNPVEGTGSEMLPDRGLPFDVSERAGSSAAPIDLTPDELEALMTGSADQGGMEALMPEEPDHGMGAGFPVLDAEMGDSASPPLEEAPLPPPDLAPGGLASAPAVGQPVGTVEPPVLATEAEKAFAMSALFLTDERLMRLWSRMDAAQQSIRIAVPSIDIARRLLVEVETARNLLLRNRDNYEEAERAVGSVELEVTIIQRSISESKVATRLLLYELAWSVVFMAILVASGIGINLPFLEPTLLFAINGAAWGGLGGIVGAIYALWRHVTHEMDFSKSYSLWYITNPIMGIFLGVVMYLIMLAGLFSLTLGSDAGEISSPFVIYVVAFIVGYRQNVAWDLIRRIIKALFQLNDSNETEK